MTSSRSSSAPPSAYRPQLATLVKEVPEGDGWIHEIKYDGYRIGCRIHRGAVTLISRNGLDWTVRFPEVRDAAAELPLTSALLDGEVAITGPDGRTSFQALQNAFGGTARPGLTYFVFDVLHLEGEDVTGLPLVERKARLQSVLGAAPGSGGVVRYSEHLEGHGQAVLKEACRLGLEGVVSKRADAPYEPGRRPSWVKTKCVARQEFVIGGFTDPEGSREGLGALLVGFYEAAAGAAAHAAAPARAPERSRSATAPLRFAGKVGTGFTQQLARDVRATLERIETRECPFTPRLRGWLGTNAHWVRPELVAEVMFTEWTGDGKIRHPSFQGLRTDKRATDVVREAPSVAPAPARGARPATDRGGADAPRAKRGSRAAATPERRGAAARPPSRGAAAHSADRGGRVEIAGVSVSHPERVLYPEAGVTKEHLARYYETVAPWMLPHLEGRPLTLVRCPTGRDASCFFMKHSKVWAPPALRRVRIREKTKTGEYLIVDSAAGLVSLAQMDVLEIHTWNSTESHLEHPDRIVLDIDPGPEIAWPDVVETAQLVRELLQQASLESWVKTTGGRGLHVVVPLQPSAGWDECLAFARAVADALERAHPDRYTTAFKKAGREQKILVDYLRNNRTNTSIAAFSTRARPNAPVSLPIAWEDLSPRLDPQRFTLQTVPARLVKGSADGWAGYWRARQRLTKRALTAFRSL